MVSSQWIVIQNDNMKIKKSLYTIGFRFEIENHGYKLMYRYLLIISSLMCIPKMCDI